MTRGNRRHVEGVVTSDRMQKSVVVEVKRLVKHPLYRKYIRRRTKLMAHDEENAARRGDRVELVETRPLSKRKSWRVLRILEKASAVVPLSPEELAAPEIEPAQPKPKTPPKKPPAETTEEVKTEDAAGEPQAAPEEEKPLETDEGTQSDSAGTESEADS